MFSAPFLYSLHFRGGNFVYSLVVLYNYLCTIYLFLYCVLSRFSSQSPGIITEWLQRKQKFLHRLGIKYGSVILKFEFLLVCLSRWFWLFLASFFQALINTCTQLYKLHDISLPLYIPWTKSQNRRKHGLM